MKSLSVFQTGKGDERFIFLLNFPLSFDPVENSLRSFSLKSINKCESNKKYEVNKKHLNIFSSYHDCALSHHQVYIKI